ncbi:MAG: alpha/beta hydrolase [Acidimicrobiia bacterium]
MVTKRAKLWLTRGTTIGLLVAVVVVSVATWLQSATIASDWLDGSRGADQGSVFVLAVGEAEITLGDGDDPERPGVWGLVLDGGRARIGPVISSSDGAVRRSLIGVSGTVTSGAEGRFDAAVWGVDTDFEAFGLTETAIEGPEGDLPSWLGEGDDDTWVIMVHGTGFNRAQALRLLPAVQAAGFPVLVPAYRNDVGAPDAGGRHGYGRDEWRDLQAAVNFALALGARDVVLTGFGSGGSIVGTFLYESRLAERVVGVILDAPILSLGAAVDVAWEPSGIPGFIAEWAKAVAALRYSIDWAALDHVARASEWVPPVLILHGREDAVSPLAVSEAFALARPDSTRLLTFPDAGANASWNTDPERYEEIVIGFLAEVAAGPSDFDPVDD